MARFLLPLVCMETKQKVRRSSVAATLQSLGSRGLRLAGAVATLLVGACTPEQSSRGIKSKATNGWHNPHLGRPGGNTMHNDSYMTGAYAWSGPITSQSEPSAVADIDAERGDAPWWSIPSFIKRRTAGQCPSVAFPRVPNGNETDFVVVGICFNASNPQLMAFTPELQELDRVALPQRRSLAEGDLALTQLDTSGAYFYVAPPDEEGNPRIVLADADDAIRVFRLRFAHGSNSDAVFEELENARIDLQPHIRDRKWVPDTRLTQAFTPDWNPITGFLPDAEGNLWWSTRFGLVGMVESGWMERAPGEALPEPTFVQLAVPLEERPDKLSGTTVSEETVPEEIQNSFAVAEDGVYLISDHALYRFNSTSIHRQQGADEGANASPWVWRWSYADRRDDETSDPTQPKPGMINRGSGTTPTLFNSANGRYVAVADNAREMGVYVLHRKNGRELCQTTLASTKGSVATENSFVAYKDSLIVTNTYGVGRIQENLGITGGQQPGLWRIDLPSCQVVWTQDEVATSTTVKLADNSDRITDDRPGRWLYTIEGEHSGGGGRRPTVSQWYLRAVDFDTGKRIEGFEVAIGGGSYGPVVMGRGRDYNNNRSVISLAPDGRSAYFGLTQGLAAVRDAPRPDGNQAVPGN